MLKPYIKDFIINGYNGASLNFTVQTNQKEAPEAVSLVNSYNEYSGKRVATILTHLNKIWTEGLSFEFGREYSPVLYVCFPYWQHDKRLSQEERQSKIDESVKLLETLRADEFDWESKEYKLRLWWD